MQTLGMAKARDGFAGISVAPVVIRSVLAEQCDAFLSDMQRQARLRPQTLRAYRYELTAAAAALTAPLDTLSLAALEDLRGIAREQCRAGDPGLKRRRAAQRAALEEDRAERQYDDPNAAHPSIAQYSQR